jgi:hypothetical protein
MNKIRFSFFVAGAALLLAAGGLHAQTSIQRLTFSLLAEYQTNIFYTNTTESTVPLTNENSYIHHILIATGNVVKALAVDLDGTNWTNWAGSVLVREVNLTNGTEGIFLRKNGLQTNVSSFFGGSFSNNFSNNFTAGLSNAFPGATNFPGLTNTFMPQLQLGHGGVRMTGPTNTTTNILTTAGLYFISLNTTNLKFNLVAVGDGAVTNVFGYIDGALYERDINFQYLGAAGSFYLNTTTNVFDAGTNPPVYLTGPLHGNVSTTPPFFAIIPGP